MAAGFGATFRRSRTRFNDRAHRSGRPAWPLGFDRRASYRRHFARPHNHGLAVPEMGAQTSVRRGDPAALSSGLDARSLSPIKETGRPGRAFPFIARPTRAYLNFEVKDRDRRRRRAFGASLSSKFRYAFWPLSDEWVFPRHARGELIPKPYGLSSLICPSNLARSFFQTALSGVSFVKRTIISWPCRKKPRALALLPDWRCTLASIA